MLPLKVWVGTVSTAVFGQNPTICYESNCECKSASQATLELGPDSPFAPLYGIAQGRTENVIRAFVNMVASSGNVLFKAGQPVIAGTLQLADDSQWRERFPDATSYFVYDTVGIILLKNNQMIALVPTTTYLEVSRYNFTINGRTLEGDDTVRTTVDEEGVVTVSPEDSENILLNLAALTTYRREKYSISPSIYPVSSTDLREAIESRNSEFRNELSSLHNLYTRQDTPTGPLEFAEFIRVIYQFEEDLHAVLASRGIVEGQQIAIDEHNYTVTDIDTLTLRNSFHRGTSPKLIVAVINGDRAAWDNAIDDYINTGGYQGYPGIWLRPADENDSKSEFYSIRLVWHSQDRQNQEGFIPSGTITAPIPSPAQSAQTVVDYLD